MKKQRIEKILVDCGAAESRKIAKIMLKEELVKVNGEGVKKIGTKFDPEEDKIEVDSVPIEYKKDIYLILNKPLGYLTTSDDPLGRQNVYDLIPDKWRKKVHPVGRLDQDSTGLLLFSSNGALTHQLTHPKSKVEKEYECEIEGKVDAVVIKEIEQGVELKEGLTRPAKVTNIVQKTDNTTLNITIHEGKHRQIRRMFGKFGLLVVKLKRIRVGKIVLGDLEEGQTREIFGPIVRLRLE